MAGHFPLLRRSRASINHQVTISMGKSVWTRFQRGVIIAESTAEIYVGSDTLREACILMCFISWYIHGGYSVVSAT